MIRISKGLIKQLLFFGLVGVGSLLIDVTVTTLVYNQAHAPAYVASAIGFLSAFFFNFPLNRKKVFRHSDLDRYAFKTQIALYVALSLFNLAATSGMTDLIVTMEWATIAYAKIIVTAIIAVWNFIILKTVVFSKRVPNHDSAIDERTLNDIM